METMKTGVLRNILVKTMLFCVFIICFRFFYVVTIRGESCADGNFCFFSVPENLNIVTANAGSTAAAALFTSTAVISDREALWTSKDYRKPVQFYSSVFQDLISDGFLSPESKVLCVDTPVGHDVFALKELGVRDAVGVSDKASKPLVVSYKNKTSQPFGDETFDFIFSGGVLNSNKRSYAAFAGEVARTLKPEGYLVVHTKSNDTYSLHSFIALFNCCTFIKFREFKGFDDHSPYIREIVMKKEHSWGIPVNNKNTNNVNECPYMGYKQEIVHRAEPLIVKEPLKPWITLKKNIQNIKYLPSMVDISYKSRYIYIDVGARSYGSSIGSWFRKQYPKQNNTFEVYAIEADKTFHGEYLEKKKWVKLLPYAAWVRNETLFFEVNHDPGDDLEESGKKTRGMGRIKPIQSDGVDGLSSRVGKITGFDFANWLKNTVTEKDFVVMKMDVEGTEFDLIPRLIETGAICLTDEIFLECHYNRWQRCCPGERSSKYEKTYGQCLDLFTSLRKSGVLVHQWW